MAQSREILVIEDNPADVRLICEALRNFQPVAPIHEVSDGEKAMLFLRRLPPFDSAPQPGLIFLDFNLPRTDSRSILRFIKAHPELQATPVVVLSSSFIEETIRDAYRLGANCYLIKPMDLDGFLHTIHSAANFFLNLRDQSWNGR